MARLLLLVLFITIALPLYFRSLLKKCQIPKEDVIDTSENNFQIQIASSIIIFYAIYLLYHGLIILSGQNAAYSLFIKLIILLICILPFSFVYFNQLILGKIIKIFFHLRDPEFILSKEEIAQLNNTVDEISINLRLKRKPSLLVSDIKNIPPFVFGMTAKNNYLVLPKNYCDIFKKIHGDNKIMTDKLNKFVLYHELSHIKHQDHLFIGTSYYFLKLFKYCLLIQLLLIAIIWGVLGYSFIEGYFNIVISGIFYYIGLNLVTLSVSRNREYLADARASIFINDEFIFKLTEPKIQSNDNKISILELLFNYFNVFSRKTKILGIASGLNIKLGIPNNVVNKIKGNKSLNKIVNIFSTHPKNEDRISRIKEKRYIEEFANVISNKSALWLGMMFGLLFAMPLVSPQLSNSLSPFQSRLSMSLKVGGNLYFMLMAILIPYIFNTRMKASTILRNKIGKSLLLVIERYFIIYSAFLITGLLMMFLFRKDLSLNELESLINYKTINSPTSLLSIAFLMTLFFAIYNWAVLSLSKTSTRPQTNVSKISKIKPSYFSKELEFNYLLRGMLPQLVCIFVLYLIILILNVSVFILGIGIYLASWIFLIWESKLPTVNNPVDQYTIYFNRKSISKADWKGLNKIFLWKRMQYFFFVVIIIMILSNRLIVSSYGQQYLFLGSLGLLLLFLLLNSAKINSSYCRIEKYFDDMNKYIYLFTTVRS